MSLKDRKLKILILIPKEKGIYLCNRINKKSNLKPYTECFARIKPALCDLEKEKL